MPGTDLILDVAATIGHSGINVADAVIGGELERTMEGASTLSIDVHDPHRVILRSADLQRAIDLNFDGTWWRLVKLRKAADTLSLTFEDRDVAHLRQHDKPRKVSRNKMTRAQFVRSLVREVKRDPITFYSPEVNVRQKISKPENDADRSSKRAKGIAKGASLTVKGARASAEQRRNAEKVLDVAEELNAGAKATKALIEAVIIESGIRNLSYGDRDSLGILQVRVSTSGSAAKSRDIEWCVRQFLLHGFYHDKVLGSGGAIAKARRAAGMTAGRVAQAVQGSGVPGAYDTVADEADAWIEAYGGASGGGTVTIAKRYEFSRGQPGKREDSWTAIARLAEEVNWRAFTDQGRLYFVAEDYLMKSQARYTLSEDDEGVNGIDFDLDAGKDVTELSVSVIADLFQVRVGSVVRVEKLGLANGRYLVHSVRRPLFSPQAEIVLRSPSKKLPEPAHETESKTKTGGASSDGGFEKGSPLAKAYRKVEQIDAKGQGYVWGGGHGHFNDSRGYDCSGFVSTVLFAAGWLDTPQATPGLVGWGAPGKGDHMTVWVKENGDPHASHTFITFHVDGKTRFAEAGGAESGHTGWHKPRSTAGFEARHWGRDKDASGAPLSDTTTSHRQAGA